MTVILYILPLALFLGMGALAAFFWALRSGQYEDLEGDAARMLEDDDQPR